MGRKKAAKKETDNQTEGTRKYVSQSDIPQHSLREALTLAQSVTDDFAGKPTTPHQVAMALDISPTSSAWRSLTGAAVAYGLTKGGYNAEKIAITELGRRCTAPTEDGDDLLGRAEAARKPKVPKLFFEKYDRAKFPNDRIAKNVLQVELDVPPKRLDQTLNLLKDDGAYVGFIHKTKTGPFVSVEDLSPTPVTLDSETDENDSRTDESADNPDPNQKSSEIDGRQSPPTVDKPEVEFRVFITHGKNKKILDQVKDVLDLYDIDHEIAVEEESPAIPVPQKVLTAMRKCRAGVMIVSADDEEAAESGAINNNVLIEIGAAFVLYDQKVVLLWDKRLKVPSNLQGLYRCEFEGDELSFAVGTKLAKAVKGFRT